MGTIPSARRLFGTDGVRGVVGEFLTADLALGLGRAATAWSRAEVPQVLIIRDTRESGEMLEAAVAAGVAAAGGHALMGGVLPTPGASLLALRYGLDLACVVSASHNPYQDNGIKFFGADGMKLPDEAEHDIEAAVLSLEPVNAHPGRVRELHGAGGDGDRVLAVDRRGDVVDGDELIALSALHLRSKERLPGDGVAVTVMTNYGFHQAMTAAGIEVATTPVGDRHVIAELMRRGWRLGGEQSGHIIDTSFVPSGDGIASALLALEALAGGDLAERGAMTKLPQLLINVRVADRGSLEPATQVWEAVEREEAALEGRGRVLVRS